MLANSFLSVFMNPRRGIPLSSGRFAGRGVTRRETAAKAVNDEFQIDESREGFWKEDVKPGATGV
jgi:hypothetical protein